MKKSSKKRSGKTDDLIYPSQVYADISTNHIQEVDGLRLFVPECPHVLATDPEGRGHFMHIGGWTRLEIRQAKFSSEFADLMIKLQLAGFCYVRIDCDGSEVKGLKKYTW